MKKLLPIFLIAALAVIACGCADDDEPFVHVEKVTIDSRELHLNPSKEHQLSVSIEPTNASNTRITWYSSNTRVATVDRNGLVTAIAFGEATITAEANDLHVNDAIRLTVDDVDNSIPITSLTLDATSKTFDFAVAPDVATFRFTPTILPAEATNKRLKWTSDDPLVASIADDGTLTALSHGKTIVHVATTDGGGRTAQCEVTVLGIKDRNYDLSVGGGDSYYRIVYYPVNITVTDAEGNRVEQTWLDRNLGAKNTASASNDFTAFGSLFQWSRKADGHEMTVWTSATTGAFVNPLAPLNAPTDDRRDAGQNGFMPTNKEPHDWARDDASNRDGLWGGRFDDKAYAAEPTAATQDNNPCPPGYRVPTVNEFIAMAKAVTGLPDMVYGNTSYKVDDLAALFAASPLKMPWAGHAVTGGTVSGGRGVYWTNMPIIPGAGNIFSNAARFIMLPGNSVYLNNYQRTNAYSVRCIRHTPLDKQTAEMR